MADYDVGWIEARTQVGWEPPNDGSVFPEDVFPGFFYLPHQCSRWKIGSVADMEAFIGDLQTILDEVRSDG